MTTPASLGVTYACAESLDPSFRIAASNYEIIRDEVLHRMTTDSVIGDTDEAISWGLDVGRECGSYLDDTALQVLGPTYGAMLQGSPLIDTADVTVTRGPTSTQTVVDLLFAVDVTPINPNTGVTGEALSFVFRLTADNFALVGNPDGGA